MADDINRLFDEQNVRKHADRGWEGPVHNQGRAPGDVSSAYPNSLLSNPMLSGRGNAPVRAAVMQRAQQTHGNRAVQRYTRAVQRSAADTASEEVPLGDRIRSRAGGGHSLDAGVQRTLEAGLGTDLSGVRVHTDAEADSMARSVDAVAFTTGNDIFFRSGTYDPHSTQGLRLLAHEVTHTVQQSQGPVDGTPAPGGVKISDPSDSYEQAAESVAARVLSGVHAGGGGQAGSASGGGSQVQRQADEEEEMQAMRPSVYASTPVQRADAPEEEEMQAMRPSTYAAMPVQRAAEEEEEPVATMRPSTYAAMPVQRQADEEEEMQAMRPSVYASTPVQRADAPEEEEMQAMRPSIYTSTPIQRQADEEEQV
jgi:hypothetical protein